MGNCTSGDGTEPTPVEDQPGARDKAGTAVLFERIDELKAKVTELEGTIGKQRKRNNELEGQLADLQEENNQFQSQHDEVQSVVTGFEQTMDKVVEEKDIVIAQLRADLQKQQTAESKAQTESEALAQKAADHDREIKRLKSREQTNQADRERLLAESDRRVQELQKELASAYASITQAQSELLSTKASLSVATDKHAQAKLKNVALEDALEELTDKYNHRDTATRAQAQKQLDQAKQLLVQGRESAKTEVEVAKQEAADLRAKVAQLAVELERANADKLLIQSKATASMSSANRDNLIREAMSAELAAKDEKLKKVNLELYESERQKSALQQELRHEKAKSAELQQLAEEAIAQAEGAHGTDSPFAKQFAARRETIAALGAS